MRSIQNGVIACNKCYHMPSLKSPPKVSGHNVNPHPIISDRTPSIEGSSDPFGLDRLNEILQRQRGLHNINIFLSSSKGY